MAKGGARRRHVPVRTCVGCRQTAGKRALLRLVRTDHGVEFDPSGKQAGRGAYVHDDPLCWQAALKGPLARALRTSLTDEERNHLMEALAAQRANSTDG
ncbi:MAG TPA: YlxR family protein [Anaerolineales bacterium]